jgi:transposase-like protein
MLCPKCKTDNAHRSRRVSVRERIGRLLGFSPYRCHQCNHRFQIFSDSEPRPTAPDTRAEKEIATTRGAFRWKQRRLQILIYGSALTLFVFVLYFLTRAPSMGE